MLNLDAPENILLMLVTFLTFQRDMSLLKDVAWKNILDMDVTWSVRQAETSLLKEDAALNI